MSTTDRKQFEMVAKTFQGLEDILAEELRNLGAINVEPGRRMVSFEGDLEMLYRANMCCRTALRILKPLCSFEARNPDQLYDRVKEMDWSELLTVDKTFSIDSVVYSDEFTHSRYVTYRVKDAIVDQFQDRLGQGKRPGVRLHDADVMLNVHISGIRVTISLDSSGESLHKRGYRMAQTDAPLNEVLAAGIILKSGWRGDCPLVDPMCGSGTFLIEAALIAANIMPGIYRRSFAFEQWPDFDRELFESIYHDDSQERTFSGRIYGGDISPKAIAIAEKNIKSAGVAKYIDLEQKALSQWDEAPAEGEPGVMITNPPYGERIAAEDMDGLYRTLGSKLKNVFKGYHAWVLGYREEYFFKIGLAPSLKMPLLNGSLECELREYLIFDGDYNTFRSEGGSLKAHIADEAAREDDNEEFTDRKKFKKERKEFRKDGARKEFRKEFRKDGARKEFRKDGPRKDFRKDFHNDDRKGGFRRFDKRREEEEPENPLAKRRNVHALKGIINRRPTLGNTTVMRSRRGWKRPDSDSSTPNPENNND
ncbi:MAG: RNA methyltransferase [Bacteroides sp.]|nr:RNA methyltransferase [Bacteroides sp.]